ncbi:glycosyltransferase family 39 protein [Cytophagaceae bacterium 50C-KIRBA]|uniref:Glycosyltransferase family 39 protein n=1 Tax=Aquirufa beregesia TaxID=2516556 RepID=A0ABX0EX90_9BACT|nr:glycosyltransferase family 39 protein [Aquirufa beregesia]NGZ44686.1 glycosyltransferase family 39 protein [Aquirufa beregesia]
MKYSLYLFILIKFVLQYSLIDPSYDLQRDEYLHLDQAHHLAWGYMSVPPFTSWISWIILQLGNHAFLVHFFPALFGALTIVVVWKTIESLGGKYFALYLGAISVLLSAVLRLNTLFQPNSFDVLAWTTCYYLLIRFIQTDQSKWLYYLSVMWAIGFLNKYNILFLILGLLPAILLSEHRKLFFQKRFYLALCLGFVIILPNLIWQYNHQFPVIHHMKLLSTIQLVHVNRLDFLRSQMLFFVGSFFVLIASCWALLFYPPFSKFRFFFWNLVFTLAIFTYFKAKDYYAIGLYPIYLSFGSVYVALVLQHGWKKYLQLIALALPCLAFIPMYLYVFPNHNPKSIIQNPSPYEKLGLLHWEDGKDHHIPQDFADMLGWKQLALKLDSVLATLPKTSLDSTIILCDNYGQAGAINYYSQNRAIEAYSMNADYARWIPLNKPMKHVILVKEYDDEDPNRTEERPLFDTLYLAGVHLNPLAREHKVSIYVLKNAKININKRVQDEVMEAMQTAY